MRPTFPRMRYITALVVVPCLSFGAVQAVAAPTAAAAVDACYNYPDADMRCNKLCRAQGASSGFCDQEDGFCICTL